MKWCNAMNMWIKDMKDKDFKRCGCEGRCEGCYNAAEVESDPAGRPDFSGSYRSFLASRFGRIV